MKFIYLQYRFQLNRPIPTHFGQLPIQKYTIFVHIITFPLNVCFILCPDITIGFTEESYTFTEGQSGAFVTLAKDAGRISQRTDIAAMISLGPSPSATPDSDFSITLLGSDIDFNPSDQSINIPLSILEDSLPEGVESFTLSVVSAGNFPFGAARTDTSPTTQVIITDNDGTF